jgi:hypothetical protein
MFRADVFRLLPMETDTEGNATGRRLNDSDLLKRGLSRHTVKLPEAGTGAVTTSAGLKEPNGRPLPDLHAMGARSKRKDVFIEIGATKADAGTSYGSDNAPFSITQHTVVDRAGHSHLPSPAVLKMVGDAFSNAPVVNPPPMPPIPSSLTMR